MKAQIISIVIILTMALIIAPLGLFVHNKEERFKRRFKWSRFKK